MYIITHLRSPPVPAAPRAPGLHGIQEWLTRHLVPGAQPCPAPHGNLQGRGYTGECPGQGRAETEQAKPPSLRPAPPGWALTWFSGGALRPHLPLSPWGASPALWTHWAPLDRNPLGDSCDAWMSIE